MNAAAGRTAAAATRPAVPARSWRQRVRLRPTLLALPALLSAAGLAGCGHRPLSRGLLPFGSVDVLSNPGDIGLEPATFEVRQTVLPSGLRVGYERAPTRGMVGAVLVIGSGSTEDPPGKEGLAHLVEHLTFHATQEGRRTDAVFARLGASYNADTALDRTRFFEFAPASALPALLRIEAQRLTRALEDVGAADVELERAVVRNELREHNETGVYGQVMSWMQSALFQPDHPYSRSVGGTHESLARVTLADARAFVSQHYGPAFATLLVVGELPAPTGLDQVLRALPATLVGDAAHPAPPLVGRALPPSLAPAYLPPPPPPGGASVMKAAVLWPEIWLAYVLPDLYGPNAPAMKVLTDDAIEARVREALSQDRDVSGVEMMAFPSRQATMLAFRITLLRPDRREQIADQARGAISALHLKADAERRRRGDRERSSWRDTRRLALTHAILQAEAFSTRVPERALYFHMTGAIDAYDRLVQAVAAMPADAVLPHAGYLLAFNRGRALYLEPAADEGQAVPIAGGGPSGEDADRSRTKAPSRGKGGTAERRPSVGADFGRAPSLPPVRELLDGERYTLPNGLRVALLPSLRFPSVTAALGFGGGFGASPPGALELERFLEGDGTFAMNGNGLAVEKHDKDDLTGDFVTVGGRNLGNALFMLGNRLRTLDQLRWDRIIHETWPRLAAIDRESAASRASRDFWAALYPQHPYGRVMSLGSLRDVRAPDIEDWLPHLYNPRNATLVVAGAFDPAVARQVISDLFSGWSGAGDARPLEIPPPPPPVDGPPREQVIVTPWTGASQVELTLGCRLPPGSDLPHLVAARMLVDALGGDLHRALREEAGLSYGVTAQAGVLRGGAAHVILRTDLEAGRFADALGIIRERWARFAREGFDAGILSQARWSAFKVAALRFQASSELALTELSAENEGWPATEVSRLPELADAVSGSDLAALFAVCRANAVMSLLGDEALIRAALVEHPLEK